MIDKETKIILTIVTVLLFISLKYAIIVFVFCSVIYLFSFFFTSLGLDLEALKLPKSEIYYQEFTGDYNELYDRLSFYRTIRNKFKLDSDKCSPFGIFYDDPSRVVDIKQCRAIVGIIRDKGDETYSELISYLKEKKFKVDTLPESQCINGSYSTMFGLHRFFLRITKLIIEMTTMKFMRRVFVPKWKDNNVKTARKNYKKNYGLLEIFRSDRVDLFIPVENEKNFFLHSEETAPKKSRKK